MPWKTFICLLAAMTIMFCGCGLKGAKPEGEINNKQDIGHDSGQEMELELDVSNWQVYRNEEYGITLKYPENWYWEDYTKEFDIGHQVIGFYPNDRKRDYEYYGDISIEIRSIGKHTNFLDYYINEINNKYLLEQIIEDRSKGNGLIAVYNVPAHIDYDLIIKECAGYTIWLKSVFSVATETMSNMAKNINCE